MPHSLDAILSFNTTGAVTKGHVAQLVNSGGLPAAAMATDGTQATNQNLLGIFAETRDAATTTRPVSVAMPGAIINDAIAGAILDPINPAHRWLTTDASGRLIAATLATDHVIAKNLAIKPTTVGGKMRVQIVNRAA